MLRSGDLHSLLKLLSSNGKIYWSQVQSDDTGRMKDFFPLRLYYQLPLYSDENGAYVFCADANCYLREYSYMRSMYSMLLYLFMDCILSRHFCKTETVVLSKGELRQFVEYFAQSITITHVLTVSHFSFFHLRASSCNSTTHTWSTVFSSFSQMSMPPQSLYSLSFILCSFANSHCSPTPSRIPSSPVPRSSPSTTSCTAAEISSPTSPTTGTPPRRLYSSTSRFVPLCRCMVVHRTGQGPRWLAQGAGAVPL